MSKYGRCIIIFRTTPIPIHLGSSLLRYPSLASNETVQQQQLFYNYYWNNNGDETAAAGRPRLTGIMAPMRQRTSPIHAHRISRSASFVRFGSKKEFALHSFVGNLFLVVNLLIPGSSERQKKLQIQALLSNMKATRIALHLFGLTLVVGSGQCKWGLII